LLPFICTLFYSYKNSLGKNNERPAARKDSLRTDIVGVSAQVESKNLSDKLDVLRENYKGTDDYTAISRLPEKPTVNDAETGSMYNANEKHMLDSIERTFSFQHGYGKNRQPNSSPGGAFPNGAAFNESLNYKQQDRTLRTAIASIGNSVTDPKPGKSEPASSPMQLFRQQIALIDSMGKAAEVESKSDFKKKHAHPANEVEEPQPLLVTKTATSSAVFNTVAAQRTESPITAIIDQDITAYGGSRLRIRSLEDIWAGNILVKAGTYLYAQVTGFSGQRINLSITSILQGGSILPVRLDLYDYDGLPGLYVPSSAFRDFTKELGSEATGTRLDQGSPNNDQQVISLLGKMFQSTTNAVSKLIRQNKALLKYSTLVYLVDPAQLRNASKNR
jgi:conjugative transposon TraM protein